VQAFGSVRDTVCVRVCVCIYKVTIRPDFTGTIPNFDGLLRENHKVSRVAELSRIPNPVPILSRFECSVTSHVAVYHSDVFCLIPIPNSL